MGIEQCKVSLCEISEPLPINPSGSYTGEQLRDILDGRSEDNRIKQGLNLLIDLLSSSAGAGEIGISSGENVQQCISDCISAIAKLEDELTGKVSSEDGKGLISDFERDKLSNIEAGAQKNAVFSVSGKVGEIVLEPDDVFGLEDELTASIVGEGGVHGVRFHNDVLEVYSGGEWVSAVPQLEGIDNALASIVIRQAEIISEQNSLIGGDSN